MRGAAIATAVAALLAAALPAGASAHASLIGGTPAPGGVAASAPRTVQLRFDEHVDARLASIRVQDEHGRRWDAGPVTGGGSSVRVALKAGTPHGRYAVLYRVVSDDGHTILGGFGFAIGREVTPPPARLAVGGGTGAPAGLAPATAVARAARDAGLTVVVGALLFAAFTWPWALAEAAGADERWRRAAVAFGAALRRLVAGAALVGAAASMSLVLLAAAPSGVSGATLSAVLETRFGRFTAAAGALLLVVGVAASRRRRALAPVPIRVAQLGATGLAVAPPARRGALALGVVLAALTVLAGHATTRAHPVLLTASGTVHVLAAAAWIGGVAALLVAARAAAGALSPADRTALLTACARRFAKIATVAVAALALTGAVQAAIEIGAPHALLDAAFGRAALIKVGLLLIVLGVAAGHRVATLQRTLRTEALGLLAILVATGALAGAAPPAGAPAGGPVPVALAFGQAQLRGTLRDGVLSFSLARRGSGLAFTDLRRVRLTATRSGGAPVRAVAPVSRDGLYRVRLPLADGRWRLAARLEIDPFNTYTRTTEVTVR